MWLQMDGAPGRHPVPVRNWLNEHFDERWIGRRGTFRWPPRSPDLTPLNFLLYNHIKSLNITHIKARLYRTPDLNQDDLIEIILFLLKIIYYYKTKDGDASSYKRSS
jgi:hypothetical protein